jgi:hypothetical protein
MFCTEQIVWHVLNKNLKKLWHVLQKELKKEIQTLNHSEHDLVIIYQLAFDIWLIFDIFKFSIQPSFQSNPTIEPWKVWLAFFFFFPNTVAKFDGSV